MAEVPTCPSSIWQREFFEQHDRRGMAVSLVRQSAQHVLGNGRQRRRWLRPVPNTRAAMCCG